LSAFINFIKFKEQWCDPFVKDLRDKASAAIVEREQVALELEEIRVRIKVLK
jgi:kinetochore protein Nuf2